MSSQYEQETHDLLVQTRTNQQSSSSVVRNKRRRIHNVIVEPIQNWIGSQLLEQNIPKTIMDQLVADHPDYPNGLLVLPTSEKRMSRVLVPRHVQYNLVIQAHLDIHHQPYRKVHKLLRPLYNWPKWIRTLNQFANHARFVTLPKYDDKNYKRILMHKHHKHMPSRVNIMVSTFMVFKGVKF
jgi:hypothetical protein